MRDLTCCSVEGCDRDRKNGGMCWSHYDRNRRHGDPHGGGLRQGERRAFIQAAALSDFDDCITLPTSKMGLKYPTVTIDGVVMGAHRYSAEIRYGAPPEGAHALHSCHNRACVNGSHLRWGTPHENMADKKLNGTDPRGSRNPRAKLTEHQVIDIVQSNRPIRLSAEMYGVTRTAVEDILAGRNWSWLTGINK